MEDKEKFIEVIGEALKKYSREPVVKVEYRQVNFEFEGKICTNEIIRLTYENGYVKEFSVSGSSCIAMLFDFYINLV